MPISQAEAEKVTHQIQDDFHKAWKSGDAKALASFYHPDAVLIARGHWASYGLTDIEKRYAEFLKNPADFTIHYGPISTAADGEYITFHAKFEFATKPGELLEFRQIYKKTNGDKYLIYHDIFEMGN